MDGEMLELMWSNHSSIFRNLLTEHREKERYTDVTIGCDGKLYAVHKLVLATCSKYFEEVFERTEGKHPVLLLHDVKKHELEALLCYMYAGSATVSQHNLPRFVRVAEALQIKGLAVPDEETFESIPREEEDTASDSETRSETRSLLVTDDDAEEMGMELQGSSERHYVDESSEDEEGEETERTVKLEGEEGAESPSRNSFQGFNCQNIKTSVDVDVKKRKILEKMKHLSEEVVMEVDKSKTSHPRRHEQQGYSYRQIKDERVEEEDQQVASPMASSSESTKEIGSYELNGENKAGLRRLKVTNPASVKLYKCSKCSFRSDYKGIKKHFVTHSVSKSFQCPHCFSSFVSKVTLHRHLKKHTQAQDFVCIYCHAKFSSKDYLSNHLETHDKMKPYCCTFCRAAFSRKDKLTVHMKRHEAEGKVLMPTRNKANAHSKSFREVFACKECPTTFKKHSQYIEHAKMHASERQFPCSVCPAAFAKKVHLSRHVLSHKGFGSRDKLQDIN